MAHCFQLTKLGASEPSFLNDIDVELATHFNEPLSPTRYAFEWFNCEGLGFASGMSFADIRQSYVEEGADERLPIIDWFAANFTVCSFRS